MKYERCLTCPAIRVGKCSGPYYMAMSTKELVEWANRYQKINGITNAQLAEKSGIPKGTIDGIKHRADVRHDTIYPLLQALIEMTGGIWGLEPCASSNNDTTRLEENVKKLEEELHFLHDTVNFAHEQIRIRNKCIAILAALLGSGLVILLGSMLIGNI